MSYNKHIRAFFYGLERPHKWDYAPAEHLEVIVSLTTVPSRMTYVQPTIVSILKQTHRPCRIELNLPKRPNTKDKEWHVPEWLSQLKAVSIHWLEHDYGPASKLIPTLMRHQQQDCLIVVIDDDMRYPMRLVEQLHRADKKAHGDVVFCANGHQIPKSLRFFDSPSDKRLKYGSKSVAIIEGCGGFSVRPRHFDLAALTDFTGISTQASKMDDIWFSGHLSRRGVKKIQIATGKRYGLPQSNVATITGARATVSNALLKYFADDWQPEEYAEMH